MLSWDAVTDDVTFSIRKFSQPAALITKGSRATYPLDGSVTHDALRRMAGGVSMNRSILVCGATGFVGTHLMKRLTDSGHRVVEATVI